MYLWGKRFWLDPEGLKMTCQVLRIWLYKKATDADSDALLGMKSDI